MQECSCLESTSEQAQEPRNTRESVVQNRSPWCFKVYHVAMSLQLTVLQVPIQKQRHLVNLNQGQRHTVNSKPAIALLFLEPKLDSVQTQQSQPSRSSDLVVQVSSSLFISRQNVLLHLYLARQLGVQVTSRVSPLPMASRGDKDELTGMSTHFLSFSLWVSLPCSLVPKLMGKLNLNCQVKLTSLRLRKATSRVSVFHQQHRRRGHCLQLRNWYSGHCTDGVLGSQLLFCVSTPQATLKRYEVPLPCAKQGRCFTLSL